MGARIVGKLLERNVHEVRCLIRDPVKAKRVSKVGDAFPDAALEMQSGNLKSRSDCEQMTEGIDLIVHAAAGMKGGAAEMFVDSVVGSRNLLDAAVKNRVSRVVLISSFGVYGVSQQKRGATVSEEMPLESQPWDRDVYSHSKLQQERLFWEYKKRYGFELVVLRPGVIYGPGGNHFSGRVGLSAFGIFLHIGGRNILPLTYVENCADAVAVAGLNPDNDGEVYNVVDDELISCGRYLRMYKKRVRGIRSVRIPYWFMQWFSRRVSWYHNYSNGQLPAIFTPYKVKAIWGGNRFSNAKLHAIGWQQCVHTKDALNLTFNSFRQM